ncbi:hypothetical protein EZS27_009579, partial [termite gut metagenome]
MKRTFYFLLTTVLFILPLEAQTEQKATKNILEISYMGFLQQIVAAIHFYANGIKRLYYLGYIGNDCIVITGQ